MLLLSGGMATVDTMVPQIIGMMKQQSPSCIGGHVERSNGKGQSSFSSDNLVKVYVPIYQKHLTLDDLKKIVAFYESPVGKKLGAVTPAITMEGMTAGQQLGMELVTLIQRELDAHGNK